MKLLCILYITFSLKCEVFPSFISFIFIANCTFYLHVNWQINLNITSSKNAKQKQLIGSTEGYIFSRTFLRVRMIAQSVSSCSQM